MILLRGLQPESPQCARDAVYVARAKRGDQGVKAELMRIAKQSPLCLMRSEAVKAFMVVGTVQDISSLDEISRNDPFDVPWSVQELENFRRARMEPPERKYPVRVSAGAVITELPRKQYHYVPK